MSQGPTSSIISHVLLPAALVLAVLLLGVESVRRERAERRAVVAADDCVVVLGEAPDHALIDCAGRVCLGAVSP